MAGEIRRTGAEDECFGPDWDADHDPPAETRTRCDQTFSEDCRDDGQYQVFDGHGLINLCLPCRRAFENREPTDHQTMNGPGREGGVPFREQQVRR